MKKIFLDCGANIGQSVDAWYLCNEDAKEYEIYSFEPSKRLINVLRQNLKKYNNVTVVNKVVWSHNEGVRFEDCGNESSSTESDKMSGGATTWNSPKFSSVDLAAFIKDKFSPEDKIVLKVDIEGGEYHLIPHLIETGAINYVDEIYMEIHAAKLSTKTIDDDLRLIESIRDQNLKPMLWTASWALKHGSYNAEKRELTEDFVIALWKKKGRYAK